MLELRPRHLYHLDLQDFPEQSRYHQCPDEDAQTTMNAAAVAQ
jgi:hypothetical protein